MPVADEKRLRCEPLEEASFSLTTRTVRHGLKPYRIADRTSYHHNFTVDVDVRWRSAKKTVRLTGWIDAAVEPMGAWAIPTTSCAVLMLGMHGVEHSYLEASAVVICEPPPN